MQSSSLSIVVWTTTKQSAGNHTVCLTTRFERLTLVYCNYLIACYVLTRQNLRQCCFWCFQQSTCMQNPETPHNLCCLRSGHYNENRTPTSPWTPSIRAVAARLVYCKGLRCWLHAKAGKRGVEAAEADGLRLTMEHVYVGCAWCDAD